MEWILLNWLPLITTVAGPIVAFMFTRRHFQKKELALKAVEIKLEEAQLKLKDSDIMSANLDLYQNMLDDVTRRHKEAMEESDLEMRMLRETVDSLRREVGKLRQLVIKYETANGYISKPTQGR